MRLGALVFVCAAAYTYAHGTVRSVTIAGKRYPGYSPDSPDGDGPIRYVNSQDPIKGAKNVNLNCGTNARRANEVAEASPGDPVMFEWLSASGGKWPHNTGPILTYMANCGSVTCDQFGSTKALWFKISEEGRDRNGVWAQAAIMQGRPASVTIPSNLAPGNYLIRHEIIALHLAVNLGGAEFYVSCTQLKVTGNGTGVPSSNDLVNFPGAYSDTDPGIYDPDVFNSGATYTFPGPLVATLTPASSAAHTNNVGVAVVTKTVTPSYTTATPTTVRVKIVTVTVTVTV